jgi:uncharacterized membrane protein
MKLTRDQRIGIGKTLAVVSGALSIFYYAKGIVNYVSLICKQIDENNRE